MITSTKKFLLLLMSMLFIFTLSGCDLDDDDDSSRPAAVTQSKEQSNKSVKTSPAQAEKNASPTAKSNKDAPAKNTPKAANNTTQNQQNAPGFVWIRTDMKVEPDSTQYPEVYIYSYEGQKNGKEYLKYLYRWSYGNDYTNADLFFGCEPPPASIPAGGKVTLEMDYRMINLAGRNSDGIVSAPAGDCRLYVAGRKAKNAAGEDFLWPGSKKGGTYHPNYLDKNCNSTQKFSANMPDNKTVGDKTDIMFTCSAGKIIWEYKLVNK